MGPGGVGDAAVDVGLDDPVELEAAKLGQLATNPSPATQY